MEYVKYYRVQGGDGNSKSRDMLSVTDSNSLQLIPLKRIHIGGEKHNRNFINLRLSEKWKKYSKVEFNQLGVNVIVMCFPKFFSDLLREYAIPEYIQIDDNPLAPPHTVDVNEGEAYAMYGAWNAIMKACCMFARIGVVKTAEEAEQLYSEEDVTKFHKIDVIMLKNFLKHAQKGAPIEQTQIENILEKAQSINREIEEQEKGYSR